MVPDPLMLPPEPLVRPEPLMPPPEVLPLPDIPLPLELPDMLPPLLPERPLALSSRFLSQPIVRPPIASEAAATKLIALRIRVPFSARCAEIGRRRLRHRVPFPIVGAGACKGWAGLRFPRRGPPKAQEWRRACIAAACI